MSKEYLWYSPCICIVCLFWCASSCANIISFYLLWYCRVVYKAIIMKQILSIIFAVSIVVCVVIVDSYATYAVPIKAEHFLFSPRYVIFYAIINILLEITVIIPFFTTAINNIIKSKLDLYQGIVLFFVLQMFVFITVWE